MKHVLIFALLGLLSLPAHACGNGTSCEIGNRGYQAKAPSGWDGQSALPVLLHFHGWGRTGSNVIGNKRIAGATEANGVLLIAPDGLGKSWSFWNESDRDVAFTKAVIEDAARHWPIDRSRIFISGFSYGSAMAWALACDSGDEYAGFLGVAGTLSSIDVLTCKTGPLTLRQVHGKKDTVMRPPWGPNSRAWTRMLSLSGCASASEVISTRGPYERATWRNCKDGTTIALDIHKGGHWIPKGWIKSQLSDLLAE